MRSLPDIALSECPDTYARFLVQGYDTVQEALWLVPNAPFIALLERTQAAARELAANLEATVDVELAGYPFKVHATGAKGGFRWRLSDDDLIVFVGSPKRDWTISVRYLSAGLWEHGLLALRERAFEALRPYTRQGDPDCVRVSRADWCFDFHSPAFSEEFVPGIAQNVVCHSSAKAMEKGSYDVWSRGGHGETLTIGSKSGLQNQLYNKTLEIDEASGKTWLYPVWLAALDGEWVFGDSDKPRDVWRLECRMSSDFLKERNVRRPHELELHLAELVAEAIYMRRLSVPNDDSNRGRWPMHPIFSEAARQFSASAMLPIGRKVTGRRGALVDRALSSLGGSLISYGVLENGEFNEANVVSLAKRAVHRAMEDDERDRKVERAQSRYSDVEEAR